MDRTYGGEPLADDGVKLATLNRGPNCELRMRWREFKGHHFFDIRDWTVNPQNAQWFPTKGKGVTIKARELDALLSAAAKAQKLAARE